jgi:hypothetical protein
VLSDDDPPVDHHYVEVVTRLIAQELGNPTMSFYRMIASKGNLFNRQYLWTCEEVAAGRMTQTRQLQQLTRLWQELLAVTELPPLPKKFSC